MCSRLQDELKQELTLNFKNFKQLNCFALKVSLVSTCIWQQLPILILTVCVEFRYVYNIPLEIRPLTLENVSQSSEVPQNRYDLPSTHSQAPPP